MRGPIHQKMNNADKSMKQQSKEDTEYEYLTDTNTAKDTWMNNVEAELLHK